MVGLPPHKDPVTPQEGSAGDGEREGVGGQREFFSPTSTFMFLLRFSFPHLPHIAYHDVYSQTFFQMCAQ